MNFKELYKNFTLSFEVFPPKTEEGKTSLFTELEKLKEYNPAFVSVTYGAGGSTREKTLDLALSIRDTLSIRPLVHFTCVGSSRSEIAQYLAKVKELGLTDILALRGDPPQGEESFTPPADGFSYANDLVSFISSVNGFSIAVAGYPEGHPESASFDADVKNLKKKIDAGASLVITQLFFNPDDYFRLRDTLSAMGSTVPVIPGIMPITSAGQIDRFIKKCGAKIPAHVQQKLDRCVNDAKIVEVGIDHAISMCRSLLDGGVQGFHMYPLNKSVVISRVLDAVGVPGSGRS